MVVVVTFPMTVVMMVRVVLVRMPVRGRNRRPAERLLGQVGR